MGKLEKAGASYFGSRFTDHVARDMREMAAAGFTYVVHTMSEFDLEFYSPRTMTDIVKCSRDAGLEVLLDPWGVGNTFGGEPYSRWVSDFPEACQVDNKGRRLPALCFAHPVFTEKIRQWLDSALSTGADGIFWDEPHFRVENWRTDRPGNWSCRCETCREKFLDITGEPMPVEVTRAVTEFRTGLVVEFLAPLLAEVRSASRTNTVCLLPFEDFRGGVSDWERIVSIPGIDTISTDPYWIAFGRPPVAFLDETVRRLVSLAGACGIDAQLWFQAFKLPAGTEKEIAEGLEQAVKLGISDAAFWGYGACAHMDGLACERPRKVWTEICGAVTRLRGVSGAGSTPGIRGSDGK